MFDVDEHLRRTSRTFALAIPLLPEPTRTEVGIAYLLFRVADTFEDATRWAPAAKKEALRAFADVVRSGDGAQAAALRDLWLADPPVEHAGYLELIGALPDLLGALAELKPPAQAILVRHATRTAEGMSRMVDASGELRLHSLAELRDYCYVVAGIVGELLTELFLGAAPQLEPERGVLSEETRAFGEGLQLVNVLKDAGTDAREGRTFLPARVDRAEVTRLARKDLDGAARYVAALQRGRAPLGFVAFTAIAVMLARASLDRLEAAGAGAKVSREDVATLFARLQSALERGDAVHPLLVRPR